jgi:hypothetical protein
MDHEMVLVFDLAHRKVKVAIINKFKELQENLSL